MREVQNLKEWSNHYHSQEEYQKTFYIMDKTMKNIHENNYYVANFNPEKINLYEAKNDIPIVEYKSLVPFDGQKEQEIDQNIYNLAFLEVGIYSDTLPYLTPEFLKTEFAQFKIFLPSEDTLYYQKVLTQKSYTYYSDFKDTQNKIQIDKLDKSLQEEGGRGKGIQKSKSTAAGRAFAEREEESKNNTAAFVTQFLLSFSIIAVSLLIPLIAWIYALTS